MVSMLLFTALQLATSSPPSCVDPAASLRWLGARHISAEQLDAAGSERMAEAVRKYLETGSRDDYRTALNRYEATGTGRYDHAARALVLGLVYASGPDLNPPGSGGYRDRLIDPDSRAANLALRHLTGAANLDSAAWLPPVALTHLALAARERDFTAAAFAALRRTLRQPGAPVAARTALADLLIATDSAALAALLLDERTDGCPGAEAALAEAWLLMGDTARGAPLLLRALAASPAEQLDRFTEDVGLLLEPAERQALALTPQAGRAAWIRDYWERSAAASARSLAQRLREHALRVAKAHREYRMQTLRTTALAVAPVRGTPDVPLRDFGSGGYLDPAAAGEPLEAVAAQAALPWDARGIVFIRHGAPDTVVQTLAGVGTYMPQTETWVYARATPPWMVHFGRWDGPDWFLIAPWIGCGDARPPAAALAEPPNPGNRIRTDNRRPSNEGVAQRARQAVATSGPSGALLARDYYLALARLDQRYDELAAHCAALATRRVDPMRIATKVKALANDYSDVVSGLLGTESARRKLARPLRLLAGAYAFRGADGAPELASFAWVPAADVAQLAADASLDLSFSLLGPSGAPLRFDSTALVRNGFEREGSVLRMAVRWPSPPASGETRLHVFVGDARDPSRGAYAEQRVPSIARTHEALSSIVVAVPGEAGPLVRGKHHVAPQPGHIVTVGESFRLFFELYGIAEDADLQTTVRIRRTRGEELEGLLARYTGKRGERELRFRESAQRDARGVVVRDVELGGELVPGDYVVEIVVRTPTGELSGSTALRIREP